MQVRKTIPPVVPDPASFRAWVQDCLALVGVSASALSRRMEVGRNTVGDFLASPERGINLSTAHGITCNLRAIAAERDLVLPQIEVVRDV